MQNLSTYLTNHDHLFFHAENPKPLKGGIANY